MSFRCPTGRSIDGLIFNLEVGGIIANFYKAILLGTNYVAFLYALYWCATLAPLHILAGCRSAAPALLSKACCRL